MADHSGAEMIMGRADERGDVVAYLEQRRDNARLTAARSPEHADLARERERQLTVLIEEFTAGMHVGATIRRDALGRWAGESNTFNQETADGGEAQP